MIKTRKRFSRLCALFLAIALSLTVFPGAVFATDSISPGKDPAAETSPQVETIPPSSETTVPDETTESTTDPNAPETDEGTVPPETIVPEKDTGSSDPAGDNSTDLTEEVLPPVLPEDSPDPTSPIPLETSVEYFDDYFALLRASHGRIQYQILTKDAQFDTPSIRAYEFEADPETPSIGFEIALDGVDFVQETMIDPAAEVTVQIQDIFQGVNLESLRVFDISEDSWLPLELFDCYSDGSTVTLSFYAPQINSRFAIFSRNSDISTYEVNYGSALGATASMGAVNQGAWCVAGKNPFGFGNSRTGTFALHLVHSSAYDPDGRTVGFQDFVAAGCLEYWKAAPIISQGQIVSANYGGRIGGWSSLSVSKRAKIASYMLYGVRYLSNYSFNNKLGSATIYSRNAVVNMAYAQQILIWSAVKGINPNTALNYYANDVPYYGRKIMNLANSNPEKYDYYNTLMLVGEGNSRQDLAIVLKPEFSKPPAPEKYGYGLRKVSSCTGAVAQQLTGNLMYSLAGAKYRVSLDGKQQEILTTDASGNAKGSKTYPVGTRLSIQEMEAPAGYKLDPTVYPLLITAGDNVLQVKDEPVMDPPFAITKVDKDSVTPQGNASFQGAIFKWEFYSNDSWSGSPTRTWYFETNEKGVADYNSSYLAAGYSSDPIYVDNSGSPSLPLGSLKMTEIKNPLGYLVLPEPLKCKIVADQSSPAGATHVFEKDSLKYIQNFSTGKFGVIESINKDLYGSIQLDKIDSVTGGIPQGDTNLQAVFQVVNRSQNAVKLEGFSTANPGEICFEFSTDADGHFASGRIFPMGKYEITEKTAPDGYQLNKDWSQVFEVTENTNTFDFTASSGMACADTPELFGSISMEKLDMETGNIPQGDATLAGAEFEIINNSAHPIFWQDKLVEPGQSLMTFQVDETGHYGYQGLPMGSYYIQEIAPPEGYILDLVWMYDFSITPDSRDVVVHPDMTCQDQPVKGGIRVVKQDRLHGAETSESDPLTGISFSVVNESKNPVVVDGTVRKPGEVVTNLEITWDGSQWSACTEKNLPYGTYSVTENEMFPGMANKWYKRNPEKHLVEVHADDSLVEVTHTNEMVEGAIVIHKVDPVGTPLAGATFLLEWSDNDGQTWNPVTNSQVLIKGGCAAPDLADGKFTTGADGLVEFTKLYPTLKYRVTEVSAPEGYVLLRDYAYSDFLPEYEYVYEMTVHNSPGFTFPTTGADTLVGVTVIGVLLLSLSLLAAGWYVLRKMSMSPNNNR